MFTVSHRRFFWSFQTKFTYIIIATELTQYKSSKARFNTSRCDAAAFTLFSLFGQLALAETTSSLFNQSEHVKKRLCITEAPSKGILIDKQMITKTDRN